MVIYVSFSNEQVGGWSTDGIIQDKDKRIPVLCNSTHLTSFCVLVGSESAQVLIAFSMCIIMHRSLNVTRPFEIMSCVLLFHCHPTYMAAQTLFGFTIQTCIYSLHQN